MLAAIRGRLSRARDVALAVVVGCAVGAQPEDGSEPGTPGDGSAFDCAPRWATPWIGAPCAADPDCSYDAGFCLLEEDGFPCGTCSAPCEALCPDLEEAPQAVCVDGGAMDVDATGHCVSRCDPWLLDGDGCRDGYACSALNRYEDPERGAAVCVPARFTAVAHTPCQQTLLDLGAVFSPTVQAPESPAGFPTLVCEVQDPVLLYGPINGVGLRHLMAGEDDHLRVACEAAISIVGTAAVAQSLGAAEIIHLGGYECRVIASGPDLSMHGLGLAFDVFGFTLGDGTVVSVLKHWEHGDPTPVGEHARLLREFTDRLWALGLWNTIFTPDLNAAHDNHVHLDLNPNQRIYR